MHRVHGSTDPASPPTRWLRLAHKIDRWTSPRCIRRTIPPGPAAIRRCDR